MTRAKKCAQRGRGGRSESGRNHKPQLPTKRRRRERRGFASPDAGDHTSATNTGRGRQPYLEMKDRKNAALEEYYTNQKIVPESEFPELLKMLATPLPVSFRVLANSRFREDIVHKLESEFSSLFKDVKFPEGGEPIHPPTRIPWYPGGLAWTVSSPRFLVRRNNQLAPFHKFIVRMHEIGAINRQEAVSMIPPLLLDMQPAQSVIDLCAAPGSKTAQILEVLSVNSVQQHQSLSAGGLVIANDADISRCWMLVHQLRRFGAPNLVVTHHDAQSFPAVTAFDRVLCDVPCTGDGTLRKAPDMWRRWTPQLGNGIHRLQKNILRRGIELLKPGGRIVYSTCSMNPVENEAVVADALRHFGPHVLELIDVSAELPLLIRRSGLRTWKVKDTSTHVDDPRGSSRENGEPGENNGEEAPRSTVNDGEVLEVQDHREIPGSSEGDGVSHDERRDRTDATISNAPSNGLWFTNFDEVPERRRRRVVSSLFPPSADELASGNFPLERCLRLLPLDQNTGAFFVAVLIKKPDVASLPDACTDGKTLKNQAEAVGSLELADMPQPEACQVESKLETDKDTLDAGCMNEIVSGAADADAPSEGDEEESTKKNAKNAKNRMGSRLITDDPLVGLEHKHEDTLKALSEFFGMDMGSCRKCLMTRGSEASRFKRIVVVSPLVRDLLKVSLGSPEGAAKGLRQRLRVVNAGVRLFERTHRKDAAVPFRILSDGTNVLRQNMTKRIVCVEREDLHRILSQDGVSIMEFSGRETRVALEKMPSGSALMVHGEGFDAEVVLIWKGFHKVTKLMPSQELDAMLRRHGLKVLPSGEKTGCADDLEGEDGKEDDNDDDDGADNEKMVARTDVDGDGEFDMEMNEGKPLLKLRRLDTAMEKDPDLAVDDSLVRPVG